MVSTLNGSRNNSLSGSTSGRSRDLRLSFPDPLTSSRDDLNTSYEDVSPALSDAPDVDVKHARHSDEPVAPLVEDPGLSLTPEVPQVASSHIGFDIVLYGYSSASKWQFVEKLLEKLALRLNSSLSPRDARSSGTSTYWLNGKRNLHGLSLGLGVNVVDRTEVMHDLNVGPFYSLESRGFHPLQSNMRYNFGKPSLAIVFLPSSLTSLPRHTLFLPVIASPRLDDDPAGFSKDYVQKSTEHSWESLDVPASRLLLSNVESPSAILHEEEIDILEPTEVAFGFEPLLSHGKRSLRSVRDQVTSLPAMTM